MYEGRRRKKQYLQERWDQHNKNAPTEAATLIASLHGCAKLSKGRTGPYNLRLTPEVQKAGQQMLLFIAL